MTEGYVSDRAGDDTVMDHPEATITIRLDEMEPGQAAMLAQQAGEHSLTDEQMGTLVRGERPELDYNHAEFHFPLQAGLVALAELEAIDVPEDEPDETIDGAEVMTGE